MIGALSRLLDPLRGAGRHAITLPPMDGALQPNQLLEEAPLVCSLNGPDALTASGETVLVASQHRLYVLDPLEGVPPREVASFEAEVVCAALSDDGDLAVGLADGRLAFRSVASGGAVRSSPRPDLAQLGQTCLTCPTAVAWSRAGELIVCNGSQIHAASEWKRDLTQRNASGSVWSVNADGVARRLAGGLAYPNGALPQPDGSVIVSESWRSRLLHISSSGARSAILSDLPGYPAGLAKRSVGGAWLALFAPRSQLFEFILREEELREQMMRNIDPEYWQAPALRPARSFLEPLQGGALKQLGIMKPWAPSRSYGLVLALDVEFQPKASAHSRADGQRHGVRSVVEFCNRLLVASKGGDAVLALPLTARGGLV